MMGKQAPDFQLSNLNGQTVSLSDFKGRKVVIGFWASWCGPCRVEMPMLVKFYRTTHKEDSKFEILAISTDTDPSAAELAAHHDKMPFPVLMDSSQKTAKAYQVEAIPTLLLVNEQGKVEWSQIGSQSSTDILLAGQLGIKNYTPQFGAQANAAGH
jgi:peroxiredoxin